MITDNMINEIRSLYYLEEYLETHDKLENLVFKNLDLRKLTRKLFNYEIVECLFIGCRIDKDLLEKLVLTNNHILASMHLPFELFPRKLYTIDDLYDKFDYKIPNSYKNSTDYEIYSHFTDHKNKYNLSTFLQVTEHIHDASIKIALNEYVRDFGDSKKIVGVMGGHKEPRSSDGFKQISILSKKLTEEGYMMVSGGGPGMMEATHLGAFFGCRPEKEMFEAINHLAKADYYTDEYWLVRSYEILEEYTPLCRQVSVGIPTWVHGHEPPNPFPAKIAKFFQASTRQDILIEITKGGIIFSPGSAGTLREVFQTVEQNHYNLWDNKYPMVFYDKKYWENTFDIFGFLNRSSEKGLLKNLELLISDDIQEICDFIKDKA